MKKLALNNTLHIPILGFGTWELKGDDCVQSVAKALALGYTHIDTADRYENHAEVAKGIKQSGMKREDFFLTTKIFHDSLAPQTVRTYCDRYLEELQTDYIDLLLIHWPNKDIPLAETLGAMHALKQQRKIKAIGVSNFTIHHLQDAIATGIEVVNNQVELHPSFNQKDLKAFCDEKGILLTAYSPLGRGKDLAIPLIKELAEKYSVSASQVILNWITSQNIVAIPKATKVERIEDNLKAVSWTMEHEDIEKMNAIPQGEKLVNPVFNEFSY